jgi:hypothetical protein
MTRMRLAMAEFGLPGARILSIVPAVVGPFGTKREYGGEGETIRSRGCPRNCER